MEDLKQRYVQLKMEEPKVRIRDAARRLGVSEAELVYTGENNILLRPDFEEVFKAVVDLNVVNAITRNDLAVHERKGKYSKPSFFNGMGLIANKDIDLRLFMGNWKYFFSVEENGRKSLQFFDRYGTAVHKIYATQDTDMAAYEELVKTFYLENQSFPQVDKVQKKETKLLKYNESDVQLLRAGWLELTDTHQFFPFLSRYHMRRIDAMNNAPEGFARSLPVSAIEEMLLWASEKEMEIMVFVGNGSCLQIHTGPVQKVVRTGSWLNVLDEKFNLHLKDVELDTLWMVRKPTSNGDIHSLEAYDKDGELILQFFGKRKPKHPEALVWRELLSQLVDAHPKLMKS